MSGGSFFSWLGSLFGGKPRPSHRVRLPRRPRSERPKLGFTPEFAPLPESAAPIPKARLTGAQTWAYKLQHNTVDLVAGCAADVFVMDPHSDGMRTLFSPADVAAMRKRPGLTDKKLVAYMSIGEAEENRFYWDPGWITKGGGVKLTGKAPKWLAAQNGEGWVDNFKVRYWDPDWQAVIVGEGMFLDRIMRAGFDGVYLDIIDGFEFFEEQESRRTARAEMVDFVRRIAATARAKRADFLVVPQNGEQLLEHAHYREAISAIGKEDVIFNQRRNVDINSRCVVDRQGGAEIAATTSDLKNALADQIPVLSVEYLMDDADNRKLVSAAEKEVRGLGYIPYFADRHLTTLHPVLALPGAPSPPVA